MCVTRGDHVTQRYYGLRSHVESLTALHSYIRTSNRTMSDLWCGLVAREWEQTSRSVLSPVGLRLIHTNRSVWHKLSARTDCANKRTSRSLSVADRGSRAPAFTWIGSCRPVSDARLSGELLPYSISNVLYSALPGSLLCVFACLLPILCTFDTHARTNSKCHKRLQGALFCTWLSALGSSRSRNLGQSVAQSKCVRLHRAFRVAIALSVCLNCAYACVKVRMKEKHALREREVTVKTCFNKKNSSYDVRRKWLCRR